MKILAYLLNIGLFVFLLLNLISEGLPTVTFDLFMVVLVFLLPIINVYQLVISTNSNNSWLSLFFARKAMEERQRIENIQNSLKK